VSAIAVTVNASESDFTDETTAVVVLDLRAQRLPEGRYPFALHLPVANSTSWQYQTVPTSLEVVGIADATQSDASVCQGSTCASVVGMRFNSTNGGAASLVVTIVAKDVDGFELKRGGEAISVTLSSRGVSL
jgi:hypothetical protein